MNFNTAALEAKTTDMSSFILPAGVYDFEVVGAVDKPSSAGNDMISLTLKVWDKAGKTRYVYDYVLPIVINKLKRFCESVGIKANYDRGVVTSDDCLGKCGQVRLEIDKGTGKHPDRNIVREYIVPPKNDKSLDADIPF